MEARESKLRSVLSWADEVEKEEAQSQAQEKQKPNPFGSARPREVVLREREARHCQYLPKPPPPHSIFREVGDNKSNVPQFLSIFHHPESAIFDPPLKYPPKNVVAAAALFFNTTYQSKNVHFQNQINIEAEKENTIVRDQAQMQLLKRPENGGNLGKPEVGNGEEQNGFQRKGLVKNPKTLENARKWREKEDDPRKLRVVRTPLGEQNGKFQEIHRGNHKRRVIDDSKRTEASHVRKMKQTWMRTRGVNEPSLKRASSTR